MKKKHTSTPNCATNVKLERKKSMKRNGCMHDNRLSNICMWFIIHPLSLKTINVGCQHSFTRSNTYVHTRAQILLIEIHDIPLELCWHVDFSMTTFNKLNIIHFEREKKTICGSQTPLKKCQFTEVRLYIQMLNYSILLVLFYGYAPFIAAVVI